MDSLAIRVERALLGAVLLDSEGQPNVVDLVQPGDMRRPWHGQVLAAMRRVRGGGGLPGPLEVYAELQHDPDLPPSVARDAVPLADLMEAAPRTGHVGVYAAMVIEGGVRQRIELAGSGLAQAAESGDLEAALHQVTQACGDLEACEARWLAILERLRADLPVWPDSGRRCPDQVRRAAAVREDIRRLRSKPQAGYGGGAGERAAANAPYVAEVVRAIAGDTEEGGRAAVVARHRMPPRRRPERGHCGISPRARPISRRCAGGCGQITSPMPCTAICMR